MLMRIALASLRSRTSTVMLTLISVLISVSLLVSVEHTRTQVKQSFTRTVSGVDLIVGARTSAVNLMLYSIFRIGNASNSIDWHVAESLADNPQVQWLIPLSLGDSHQGFRVVGTDNRYFEHFKYGAEQPLQFSSGSAFENTTSVVLGADVASALKYNVGDQLTLSHGISEVSFVNHADHPLTITGLLAPTGTPADKAVYVTLSAIEAIHDVPATSRSFIKRPRKSEQSGTTDEHNHHNDEAREMLPESVTALLVGLNNRAAALQLQYQLNQAEDEPVTAILPGMTLAELWQLMAQIENLLRGIVIAILVTALLGLAALQLATLRFRQREFALLRTLGAGPATIMLLIELEALIISGLASLGGVSLSALFFYAAKPWLSSKGLMITDSVFNTTTLLVCVGVMIVSALVGLIPAILAYRTAAQAQLTRA